MNKFFFSPEEFSLLFHIGVDKLKSFPIVLIEFTSFLHKWACEKGMLGRAVPIDVQHILRAK